MLNEWSKDKINKMFNKYDNLSVKEFMYELTRKYDKTCEVVGLIYKDVMLDIGMENLHGKTYYLKL